MKYFPTLSILIAAFITGLVVTYIKPSPLNSILVFLVPVIYVAIASITKTPKSLDTMFTGLLFIFALNIYTFGGYLKTDDLTAATQPGRVTDVSNIGQLSQMIKSVSQQLPINVDPVTDLIALSINESQSAYVMTLKIKDVETEFTDKQQLNAMLSEGLKSQCDNKSFIHLKTLGINVIYRYIDLHGALIGAHRVKVGNCDKTHNQFQKA